VNQGDLAEIERRRLRALVDGDLPVADQLHADDFQLITPSGESVSKEEYLQRVASGEIDYLVWDPEEIDAHIRDDAACLRYRSTIKIIVDGRSSDPNGIGIRTSTRSAVTAGRSSGRRPLGS
jgi:uncharacterized protein DUF4440